MANPLGFTWDIGNYQNPDIVVPANGPIPAAPPPLPCPGGTVVIYAADIVITANARHSPDSAAVIRGPIPWR